MNQQELSVTLIQSDIVWEDKATNLKHYEAKIEGIKERKCIVILPEMFSTGFSMNAKELAELMDGPTVRWMAQQAAKHKIILTGSLIIEEDNCFYNRMVWMQPDGNMGYYDKRHLFGYAKEDQHYTRGETRQIVQVNGWRINLQICYDLRFPVWARNAGEAYDVLIYVANWPQVRSTAWKTLLQARAIENMCYVVGVNRVGNDAKGLTYSGDSSVFGPLGELLWTDAGNDCTQTVFLNREHLTGTREKLPFLKDADKYIIT